MLLSLRADVLRAVLAFTRQVRVRGKRLMYQLPETAKNVVALAPSEIFDVVEPWPGVLELQFEAKRLRETIQMRHFLRGDQLRMVTVGVRKIPHPLLDSGYGYVWTQYLSIFVSADGAFVRDVVYKVGTVYQAFPKWLLFLIYQNKRKHAQGHLSIRVPS